MSTEADLCVHLGQRLVGIVIQLQRHGDHAAAVGAGRGHVIYAVDLGDRIFQRGGDEAGDQIGIGAEIGRAYGDNRILRARELKHRQDAERAQPQHQQGQADDDGQYRPPDE